MDISLYRYIGRKGKKNCWSCFNIITKIYNLVKLSPQKSEQLLSAAMKCKLGMKRSLRMGWNQSFFVAYPPPQCHHQTAARSRGSSRWWCSAHGLGHCKKRIQLWKKGIDQEFIWLIDWFSPENVLSRSLFHPQDHFWLSQLFLAEVFRFVPNCFN